MEKVKIIRFSVLIVTIVLCVCMGVICMFVVNVEWFECDFEVCECVWEDVYVCVEFV